MSEFLPPANAAWTFHQPGKSGRIFRLFCLVIGCLALAGCSWFGAAAYVVNGPEKIKPLYVPSTQPMLVLVENYRNSGTTPVNEQLGYYLTEEMRATHDAPMIEPEALHDVRAAVGDQYQKMHISDIGKATGAGQVLYIDIVGFEVEEIPGSEFMRGKMAANVKVIDAATGQTLWPLDMPRGYSYSYETKMIRKGVGDTPETLRSQMLQVVARHIGRLFYEYSPEDQ